MNWEDKCCLARARLLVLRELTDLGVKPTAAQLKKALDPVLCELGPAAVDRRAGRGRPRDRDGRFLARESAGGSGALMPRPSPGAGRGPTVDHRNT